MRYANKGKDKVHSKQSDMNRQEFTTLDSRGHDADEDNDNLGSSLPAAKTVGEFEKRLQQL